MAINHPAIIVQLLGFGVFLWLGLYLLVRSVSRTPEIVVTLLGMFSQAVFFAAGVLTDTATDRSSFIAIERWSWWSAVLPVAAWFHFSSLIVRQTRRHCDLPCGRNFTPVVVIVYVAAAGIGLLGGTSGLFADYAHPVRLGAGYELRAGPAYLGYVVYLALVVSGALTNTIRALRLASHNHRRGDRLLVQQLRLLVGGALFFFTGGMWLAVRQYWQLAVSVLPGYLCLFLGLVALGYGMVLLGLLLHGQNIRRDFIYNLTGMSVMNLLYTGLFVLTGQLSAASLLGLVGLVTLTHTAFDNGREALDTLFFNRAERAARAEARAYATLLGTAPAPALDEPPPSEPAPELNRAAPPQQDNQQGSKEFKDQVRRALTGLKCPPKLATSPLLGLKLVEQRVVQSGQTDNRLNRAAALREILTEQIEGLRPTPSVERSNGIGDSWRFYNVLYYPYMRELSRKSALSEARRLSEERRRVGQRELGELEQVLNWLADVDEDTFYKWQRRASDMIATIVWEEDRKLRE